MMGGLGLGDVVEQLGRAVSATRAVATGTSRRASPERVTDATVSPTNPAAFAFHAYEPRNGEVD
jgi:hypothetical protein